MLVILSPYTGQRMNDHILERLLFRRAAHTGLRFLSRLCGLALPALCPSLVAMTVVVGPADADYIVDGSNDHVELQQAIDTVAAAGGGKVILRQGIYNCGAEIVIPHDGRVRIVGEKMAKGMEGGVILRATATLTNLVSTAGSGNPATNADLSHDIHFEHITFNGNGRVTNVVSLTNADFVSFTFCRVIGGVNGIVTVWDSSQDPTAATVPGGLFITNSILSASTGIALDLQYQTQCWISNVWFSGPGTTSTWINFRSSNKIHIANCEFNTATQALRFQDTGTRGCHDITITGCTFSVGSGNKCWTEQRTHGASKRVLVSGCINTDSAPADTLAGGSVPLASVGF
ncbi:hypothetical protein OPIT5_17405 [Opitutaceae bacterium TAV5]|nr:hypothetical protein OPIT5_17405 [Opitutaceae bacterium TAV5]